MIIDERDRRIRAHCSLQDARKVGAARLCKPVLSSVTPQNPDLTQQADIAPFQCAITDFIRYMTRYMITNSGPAEREVMATSNIGLILAVLIAALTADASQRNAADITGNMLMDARETHGR